MESGTGNGTRPSEFLVRESLQLLRVIHAFTLRCSTESCFYIQLLDLRLETLSDSHPSRHVMYEILHGYTTGNGRSSGYSVDRV
jgi:hypothetical protein